MADLVPERVPLTIEVRDGKLVIEIGIETLMSATAHSQWVFEYGEDGHGEIEIHSPEQLAADVVTDDKLGKVSIVGTGMITAPGYASRMFRTLFENGINIEMISTSDIRITCIVNESKVSDAVRALHSAFELDKAE